MHLNGDGKFTVFISNALLFQNNYEDGRLHMFSF